VLKLLFVVIVALTAAEGTHDPQVPTPPAGPTAPKVEGPTSPSAPHKTEAAEVKKPDPAKPDKAEKTEKTEKGEKTEKAEKAGEAKPATVKAGADKPGEKPAAEKPVAEKPADQAGDKATAKPGKAKARPVVQHERASTSGPALPALSQSALHQEIRQNAGEDKSAPTAPLSERARLEQLAAEIIKAREALKQDTARLESMLKGGDGRMPMGDGMGAPASGVDAGGAASREAMKEQIMTVSKAMKGMKPEQAAAIIARLDRVLASEILRRMKAADAGAVMASLKPELAADLATTIATRRSMVDGDPKKDGKK
jgi:flagellar motility protein MotE (MotC chaperone)